MLNLLAVTLLTTLMTLILSHRKSTTKILDPGPNGRKIDTSFAYSLKGVHSMGINHKYKIIFIEININCFNFVKFNNKFAFYKWLRLSIRRMGSSAESSTVSLAISKRWQRVFSEWHFIILVLSLFDCRIDFMNLNLWGVCFDTPLHRMNDWLISSQNLFEGKGFTELTINNQT